MLSGPCVGMEKYDRTKFRCWNSCYTLFCEWQHIMEGALRSRSNAGFSRPVNILFTLTCQWYRWHQIVDASAALSRRSRWQKCHIFHTCENNWKADVTIPLIPLAWTGSIIWHEYIAPYALQVLRRNNSNWWSWFVRFSIIYFSLYFLFVFRMEVCFFIVWYF